MEDSPSNKAAALKSPFVFESCVWVHHPACHTAPDMTPCLWAQCSLAICYWLNLSFCSTPEREISQFQPISRWGEYVHTAPQIQWLFGFYLLGLTYCSMRLERNPLILTKCSLDVVWSCWMNLIHLISSIILSHNNFINRGDIYMTKTYAYTFLKKNSGIFPVKDTSTCEISSCSKQVIFERCYFCPMQTLLLSIEQKKSGDCEGVSWEALTYLFPLVIANLHHIKLNFYAFFIVCI